MKRLLFASFGLLLLSACGQTPTVSFLADVTGVDSDVERQTVLVQSLNVLERRLLVMGEDALEKNIDNTASGAIITVGAEHREALDALSESVQEPFDLQVMAEAQEGQSADVTVERHGGFVRTGITAADLDWVEAGQESDSDLGAVRLVFTEEGRVKMADLFRRMNGKNIGIFVRGQLVSLLQVETAELKDDIIIRQIPSMDLATVFAEDVNIGIHVQFTPVP